MLVLSRKHGEEIIVAGDVHITVVSVQGNRVKLGITAPQDVAIRRGELDERMDFQCVALAETQEHSPERV